MVAMSTPVPVLFPEGHEVFERELNTIPREASEFFTTTSASTKLNEVVFSQTVEPVVMVTEEGNVILDRPSMGVGLPYPFRLDDVFLVAVKRADGTVDFFSLP